MERFRDFVHRKREVPAIDLEVIPSDQEIVLFQPSERPSYEAYVPQSAKRNVPRSEKADYTHTVVNPFLIDALMWEAQRRERQVENERE